MLSIELYNIDQHHKLCDICVCIVKIYLYIYLFFFFKVFYFNFTIFCRSVVTIMAAILTVDTDFSWVEL